MARGTAYLVFLVPVVISVPASAYVMYGILEGPDPGLDARTFDQGGAPSTSVIEFVGVRSTYAANDPIDITARILDPDFDCGDVYVTIYDPDNNPVAQSAFFEQCFSQNRNLVPVGDEFSKPIGMPGEYEIILDVLDRTQTRADSASVSVRVR